MAAGLGYKEFATGDVLTAAQANGYLASQVIMVFADSAARSAAITSPQEGMFSYLKNTDTTQYYNGTVWVNFGVSTSPLTTKGDLYTFATADTRLPVGTNGQVLSADSTQSSGLKWTTSGMVLISTTTCSGTTVTLSSIPQTYRRLLVYITGVSASVNTGVYCNPNGVSTSISASSMRSATVFAVTGTNIDFTAGAGIKASSTDNAWALTIDNYTSSTAYKPHHQYGRWLNDDNTQKSGLSGGAFGSNTAITSLDFTLGGNTFTAGTILLYGVS